MITIKKALEEDWLNFRGDSHLRVGTMSINKKLQEAISNGRIDKIDEYTRLLMAMRKTMSDPSEKGEVSVVCAVARQSLRDRKETIDLLSEAVEFYKDSPHQKTVTQWMLGRCYAERPDLPNDKENAILTWVRCLNAFNDLSCQSMDPLYARFYSERLKMIEKDIEYLLKWAPGPD